VAQLDIPDDRLYGAAARGQVEVLRQQLADRPESASEPGGPMGWVPLLYLCFSPYLRAGDAAFVEAARLLLEAGASAQAGFFEGAVWESALYGAAGRAHHVELSRLLLKHGADPNDEETPYHVPESYDLRLLELLVPYVDAESLTTMLLRKADMHDLPGIVYLLEHGADPNRPTRWQHTAFEQALRRDNSLDIVKVMLQHGAVLSDKGLDLACRRGRGDVLELLQLVPDRPDGRCALGLLPGRAPEGLAELLAQFAGNGNQAGVARLLEAGAAVDGLYAGDGYYAIAPASTALHVACWRGRPPVVKLLLEHGADVRVRDGHGRSPLQLAVKACVDSYWTDRRSPDSVAALLTAGADPNEIAQPCGYDLVDRLLKGQKY